MNSILFLEEMDTSLNGPNSHTNVLRLDYIDALSTYESPLQNLNNGKFTSKLEVRQNIYNILPNCFRNRPVKSEIERTILTYLN